MSNDGNRKMAHGALWMVLFKLVERSLGFISLLILVRLLSPADFGIVSMALSFIVMAELLTAFGFDVALIQSRDATEEHYHTAWTCNVILGALITTLMIVAAAGISDFYKQPELPWVIYALSLGPLITGCENIGVVAFRKDMQFRREFAFQLSRKVIGFMVVVPLAYYLRNYWALVAGTLTSKFAGTAISYLAHPFRPHFTLAKVRGLMGFSKWLLLNNVVGFLKERVSDFFIGRMLGPASLGTYNVGYEVATMPTTELSAPINRALLPGFSRIAHEPEAMRAAFFNAVGMLALFAVPASAGIYALAPLFVPTLIGAKWLAAVPLMEILAFNGALLLFHSSICTALIASGHPDRVAKTNGAFVLILLILLGLLVPAYGSVGAAFAALGASVLSTPIYLFQVNRSVGAPPSMFLMAAARPVAAAFIMTLVLRWIIPDWTPDMKAVVSIAWTIAGIALGMVTYLTAILSLWLVSGRPSGAERAVHAFVKQRFMKRRTAPASTPS